MKIVSQNQHEHVFESELTRLTKAKNEIVLLCILRVCLERAKRNMHCSHGSVSTWSTVLCKLSPWIGKIFRFIWKLIFEWWCFSMYDVTNLVKFWLYYICIIEKLRKLKVPDSCNKWKWGAWVHMSKTGMLCNTSSDESWPHMYRYIWSRLCKGNAEDWVEKTKIIQMMANRILGGQSCVDISL